MQSLPRPIEGGTVAQSIVRYRGLRLGNVSYRGLSSRREYRFGASPGNDMHYVLDEDLPRFRLLQDFEVPEEGRIDPAADRLERMRLQLEASIEARLVETIESVAKNRTDRSRTASGNRGGRPPVPQEEIRRAWHERHHTLPPRSMDDLAAEFVGDESVAPRRTMSTRLSRFKKAHPHLTVEGDCPWCDPAS